MRTLRLAHRARQGFTLIELLTVIAIIGILAAIIIPTVGAVRQTARESQNLSNLRQIALALNVHANDNKDRFMSAGNQNDPVTGVYLQHWKTELGKYILNKRDNAWVDTETIFVSPTATNRPDVALSQKPCHYSLHALLTAPNGYVTTGIPRSSVLRPSQVILVADSAQTDTNGQNASDVLYSPTQFTQRTVSMNLTDFIPAPATSNVDAGPGRGALRYRNRDSVHVGMVDGSARSFKRGTVTYGNLAAAQ